MGRGDSLALHHADIHLSFSQVDEPACNLFACIGEYASAWG